MFGKVQLCHLLLSTVLLSGMINICQCLISIVSDGQKIKGNVSIVYLTAIIVMQLFIH